MHRRLALLAAATAACVGLAGCSDDNGGSSGGDDQVTSINISIQGDTVSPNGIDVKVPVGEPITLRITADLPGELHVHTAPEQEIEYPAGKSTRTLQLDRPGVYEVESHDLDKIVVKLEAS